MSYTTIYKVTPGVSAEPMLELQNAWGSAPLIWGTIQSKVLHKDRHSWGLASGGMDQICQQWHNLALPEFVCAVLGMTFDRPYIERQHFMRAAKDIRQFLEWAPQPPAHVNHWPEIADKLVAWADDESIPAIGFHHTSVSESLWEGQWNEEKDSYDPLEWGDFWSLYPELDARAQPSVQGGE